MIESTLPVLFFRCREADSSTLIEVGPNAPQVTGFLREELLVPGRWKDLVHPEDRERVSAEVGGALPGGLFFEVSFRLVRADGTERTVRLQGRSVPGEKERFWEGVLLDVTAHMKTEEALRESETKFSAAFRAMPQSLALTDLETGLYLEVNEGFERVSGYTREEILGRTAAELGLWADPEDRKILVHLLSTQGYYTNLKMHFRQKGGRPITALCSGSVLLVDGRKTNLGVLLDITEQLETQAQLEASQQKFEAAFRSSPYSLTVSELATGRYLDVNLGFETLSGFRREEVLGRTSLELGIWANPLDRERLVAALVQNPKIRGLEVQFRTKSGQDVYCRCSFDLISWDGEACLLNALEDMTAHRQAERDKAALQADLHQAQRLEALGRLAGGIAHDFNNILTGIMANTELARLEVEDSFRVLQRLGEVNKASLRARDIVRQILTFSQQQISERRALDLGPVVLEAVELLGFGLPGAIQIETVITPTLPRVYADPTQIHQVVMNLGTNAAQALGQRGGRIVVRLTNLETPNLVELSVSDDGPGMDEQVLKRIFDPFFTTKPQGTGLGLSVVDGIVKSHKATLAVDSAPGAGTMVRILFPTA